MFVAYGTMHRRCSRLVSWMRWYDAAGLVSRLHHTTSSSLPAGRIVGALYHKLQTRCSAPEDGGNYRQKHVELIGSINKPLLLHLVGCLYYCINDARPYKHQINKWVPGPSGRAV